MCFQKGDFLIADHDVQMGEIGGVPFYIGGLQFEAWKHTRLIIDVVEGQGGMFSLDNERKEIYYKIRIMFSLNMKEINKLIYKCSICFQR